MASSQRSKDPHLGLRFWVEVGGIEVAGFSECSGASNIAPHCDRRVSPCDN